MSASDDKLSGPDLARGVPLADLPDGGMLLGHAEGEAVLLARVGDDVHAVGASCTHYGGPLAEGLLVGATVRCPWHHACFHLGTGEAVRAPALNPLPTWEVLREGDRVRVGARRERDPLARSAFAAAPGTDALRRVVIVGAGAAGVACAEMLRREGYAGRITVVDHDADAPYDRPNLSKDYLAGNAPEEWIPIRPDGFWAERGIEVVRAEATRLDTAARRLELRGAEPLAYDALLLATGAEPIRLGIPGAELPHVFTLRSLADSRAIIARAAQAGQVVVIGGSFIGLETASALRARGLAVHVVAPEAVPLERVLGREAGEWVRGVHEAHGVVFHLGTKPRAVDATHVELEDGTRLAADLVIMGVGVRPRLALAEQAGLAVDKGVLVDERLETSAPGVFAAGDIARWPDPHGGERLRVEHWVVAERQGQTAARNILGHRERFDAVPFFWSQHYDVGINYVGHATQWARIDRDGELADRDATLRYCDPAGRVLAVATVYRDLENLRAEVAMERQAAGSHEGA